MRFKNLVPVLLFLAGSVTLFAQQPNTGDGRERARIDGVIRVLIHQPGDYSVMTFTANGEFPFENGGFPIRRLGGDVEAWGYWLQREKDRLTDVPRPWKFRQVLLKSHDGKLSVVAREYPSRREVIIAIYINSEKDVCGAGWEKWDGGIHTEGMTMVVR